MKFRSRFAVVGTLLAAALALLVSLPALALDSMTSVTSDATLTISVHANDEANPGPANAEDTKVLNVGGGTTVWVAAMSKAYNKVLVDVDNAMEVTNVAVANTSTRKNLRHAILKQDANGNRIYKTADGVEGTVAELEAMIATGETSIDVTRVLEYLDVPSPGLRLDSANHSGTFIVVASDAHAVPSDHAVLGTVAITDGESGARASADTLSYTAPQYLVAGNNDEIQVTVTGTVPDGPDDGTDPDPFSVANDFSLKVDSQAPRISAMSPAPGGNQSSFAAAFGATFTDAGSGLITDAELASYPGAGGADADGDNITGAEPLATDMPQDGSARDININVFKGPHATRGVDFGDNSDITSKGTSSWRQVSNGFSVSIVDSPLASGSGGTVYYAFRAKDRVGNVAISGQGGPRGMKNHLLVVDLAPPVISDALAGKGYKPSAKNPEDDANDLKSIKLVFSGGIVNPDVETLDASTVEASDFTVVNGGAAIEVVDVDTSPLPVGDGSDNTVNNVVYLVLADNLPPAATPRVSVVGSISDLAGNRVGAGSVGGSITATDKTAPVFTTSVSGSVTDRVAATGSRTGQITIRVSSNEDLRNVPTLRVAKLTQDGTAIEVEDSNALSGKAPVAVQGVDNTWELTTQVASSGLYAVYVTGDDTSPVPNMGGAPAPAATTELDADARAKLTLFEIDNSLSLADEDFVLTPSAAAGKTQTINPFIRINFAESGEYPLDTHKSVTLTKLVLRDANAEETDLLGMEGAVDSDSFLVSLSDLELGKYTLVVNAMDELGNALSRNATFDFEVVQRPKHSVSLWPGNNLVSVPGDPVDPSIDVVLPAEHPATAVLSYDPTDPVGPWLAATREAGGSWSGPLTEIRAGKGYWVDTSTFAPLSVQLEERGSGEVPPTYALASGWNLVGVVAASLDSIGDGIAAKDYFASINWSVAYTYDTGSNRWQKLTGAASEPKLKAGQGVWVWAENADVLAP